MVSDLFLDLVGGVMLGTKSYWMNAFILTCMGLFSFLGKNKRELLPAKATFTSRAEESTEAARGPEPRRQARRRPAGVRESGSHPVLPEKKRARRRLGRGSGARVGGDVIPAYR